MAAAAASSDAKGAKRAALFYTPTSCGQASFIAAHRAGLELDAHLVDMSAQPRAYQSVDGPKPYAAVNPKLNVPTIVLPDGVLLNENVATLQWIADQNPAAGNAPAVGTAARYELQNVLAWLASELHQAFTICFLSASPQRNPNGVDVKTVEFARARLDRAFGLLETWALADKQYLIGSSLTVADIYAHVLLGWADIPFLAANGVTLKPYPKTLAFRERIRAHPDVVAAQKAIAANAQTTKPGAASWPKPAAAADAAKK